MSVESTSQRESKERVIERIKKILAKVQHEGGATATPEAEVEAALKIASRLMEQFNIDESEVYSTEKGKQSVYESIVEMDIYSRAGKIDQCDKDLARAIATVCDVKRYYESRDCDKKTGEVFTGRTGKTQKRQFMIFYGLPRDCEVAKQLYMEIFATMLTMVRVRFGPGWNKGHDSYCLGFADVLCQRATAMKQASKVEAGTTGHCSLQRRYNWSLGLGTPVPCPAQGSEREGELRRLRIRSD